MMLNYKSILTSVFSFVCILPVVSQTYPIKLNFEESTIELTDFLSSNELERVRKVSLLDGYSFEETDNFNLIVENRAVKLQKNAGLKSAFYVLQIESENGKIKSLPVFPSEKIQHNFVIPDKEKKHSSISIKGTFNGWTASKLQLKYNNGNWVGTTLISPGIEQYVLLIDGKESVDPTNVKKVSNGFGGFNSIIETKTKQLDLISYLLNDSQVIVKSKVGEQKVKFVCFLGDSLLTPEIIEDNKWVLSVVNIPKQGGYNDLSIWSITTNARSNNLWVPILDGRPINELEVFNRLNNPRSMIIYNPMIDRFNNGDTDNDYKINNDSVNPKVDYFGGDLQGINSKLEKGYFRELGVNTIWVSPIVENPNGPWGQWLKPRTKFSGYHGYWPTSLSKIDSRYGGEKAFSNLITNLHSKDMRILLDYVAHHVHQTHPMVKQFPDWFTSLYLEDGTVNMQLWDEQRLTTWFDTFLPTFKFSNPEVVEALTDSAIYWINKYPIDGFRHDATKHIPNEFWRSLTRKIKSSNKKDFFQIGETYGSPELIASYLGDGLLDAQFDFNLYDAAVNTFKSIGGGCTNLSNTLKTSLDWYGQNHLMGNITGNQDRPRFVSKADGSIKDNEDGKQAGWDSKIKIENPVVYEQLQNLMAFNISVPGIPIIYYGDEIGMPGGNDPDNRRMMRFDDQLDSLEQENLKTFQRLNRIRANSIALQLGQTFISNPSDDLIIVRRKYFNIEEVVFVFYNGNDAQKANTIKQNFSPYYNLFENSNQYNKGFTAIFKRKQTQ